MKLSDIELLATLENLRIRYPENDHVLRVASAIVAKNCGYNSRMEWTNEIKSASLVDYDVFNLAANFETMPMRTVFSG